MALQALCWTALLMTPLCASRSVEKLALEDGEESGDGEGAPSASPSARVTLSASPTSGGLVVGSVNGTLQSFSILDGIVDFFQTYMLLIVVVGSLILIFLSIVCAAVIVQQKHKASAYYPSSFPKKKYVNQQDKSGGAKVFSEIPEKPSDVNREEPVDSTKQLQADILAAAQNLKSPTKAVVANGKSAPVEDPPPAEGKEEGARRTEEGQDDSSREEDAEEKSPEEAEMPAGTSAPNNVEDAETKEEGVPSAVAANPSPPEEPKEPPATEDPATLLSEGEKEAPAIPPTPDACPSEDSKH